MYNFARILYSSILCTTFICFSSQTFSQSVRDCASVLVLDSYKATQSNTKDFRLASFVSRQEYDKAKQSGGASAVIYGVPAGANYDSFHEKATNLTSSFENKLSEQQFIEIVTSSVGANALIAYRDCVQSISSINGLSFIPLRGTDADITFVLRYRPVGSAAGPLDISWVGGEVAEKQVAKKILPGDTTFIFPRPKQEQTVAVNGDGYTASVVIGPVPAVPPLPPPPPPPCGGIENARTPFLYSGDLYSNTFRLNVPECGNFTINANLGVIIFGNGPIGETPPSPQVLDVLSSLCAERGVDIHGPFTRVHINRGCGLPGEVDGPGARVFIIRPDRVLAEGSISNWAEMIDKIKQRNNR